MRRRTARPRSITSARISAEVGLVVSDWDMPELNGLQLLQTCKGSSQLKEIPFLMITSQSSIESMKVVQAARSSVDDYLLKPFSLGDIRKRIEGIIDKERTKTEVQTASSHEAISRHGAPAFPAGSAQVRSGAQAGSQQ